MSAIACMIPVAMLATSPVDRLLDAMETVESHGNRYAVGDGGRSYGYYQLQRAYVDDAIGRHVSLSEYRRICTDRAAAIRAVKGYWARYAPSALRRNDLETLARVHNGGPRGDRLKQTQAYWVRVKRAMSKEK